MDHFLLKILIADQWFTFMCFSAICCEVAPIDSEKYGPDRLSSRMERAIGSCEFQGRSERGGSRAVGAASPEESGLPFFTSVPWIMLQQKSYYMNEPMFLSSKMNIFISHHTLESSYLSSPSQAGIIFHHVFSFYPKLGIKCFVIMRVLISFLVRVRSIMCPFSRTDDPSSLSVLIKWVCNHPWSGLRLITQSIYVSSWDATLISRTFHLKSGYFNDQHSDWIACQSTHLGPIGDAT